MHKLIKLRGFSLVEVMVGLTLTLLGMLVILQVLATMQKNKLDTVSSGDAQQNGAMALYSIGNSVSSAGYGIGSTFYAIGACTNAAGTYLPVSGYKSVNPAGDVSFWLAPVVITNGAGGNADSIAVMQGNTSITVSPMDLAAKTSDVMTVAAGTTFNFNLGDVFLIHQAGKGCMIGQVTSKDAVSSLTFAANEPFLSPYTNTNELAKYNKSGGITSADASLAFTDGAKVLNLGPSPTLVVYSVINGSLNSNASTVFDGPDEVVVDGIVNLQAQYGVDTTGDGAVDSYIDAPAATPAISDLNADGVVNQADWARVKAIRVAILARGIQRENACDSTQPRWSGGAFDMTALTDWQCYRYRVFETVMSLRNVVWDPT